jgi:hypothetical protein
MDGGGWKEGDSCDQEYTAWRMTGREKSGLKYITKERIPHSPNCRTILIMIILFEIN